MGILSHPFPAAQSTNAWHGVGTRASFFSSVSLRFPVLKMERLLSAGLMGLLGKFQGLAKQVPHRVSALNPVLPSPPTEAQVAKQRGCLLQKESGG